MSQCVQNCIPFITAARKMTNFLLTCQQIKLLLTKMRLTSEACNADTIKRLKLNNKSNFMLNKIFFKFTHIFCNSCHVINTN